MSLKTQLCVISERFYWPRDVNLAKLAKLNLFIGSSFGVRGFSANVNDTGLVRLDQEANLT